MHQPGYVLSPPLLLLLASCASDSVYTDERADMERKLIGFQEKFDRFDDNGDGYLTQDEIHQGFIREKVTGADPNDVPMIMTYYDQNRDGRISLREVNAVQAAGPDAALEARKRLQGGQ